MKALYFAEKCLEAQDVFAVSFKFNMNGQTEHHSPFSIICSLTMNITCLIFFITLILPLLKRSDPTVNFMKLSGQQNITNISLNEDYFYSISVLDRNHKTLNDERIVSLVANYTIVTNNNGDTIIKKYPLEFLNCTTNYHIIKKYKLESRFKSFNLINYTCFKHKEKEIILGGKYGTKFYANLQIYAKKCINSTENNNHCKPQEEINSILQGAWIEIIFLNSYVDIYNYSNPIQYMLENYYSQIDVGLNKLVYQFFSPVKFYSDNNILFSKKTVYKAPLVESSLDDVDLLDEKTGIVYFITFGPAYTETQYFRKYVKIQEICSSTGGTWYVLRFVFYLLRALYRGKELNYYLADSLSIIDKKTQDLKKKKTHIVKRSTFLPLKNKYKDNDKSQSSFSINNKSNFRLNKNDMKLINNDIIHNKKMIVNKSNSVIKNNIYNKKGRNYTFLEGAPRSSLTGLSLVDSKLKRKYGFISMTLLIFCPCLSKSKTMKKEYDYLYNKVKDYCDFIKVTRLLMVLKEEAENLRKNINEVKNNIQFNEQFYKNNDNEKSFISIE